LTLPGAFAFSQSSLQAYEDCPRRFWLSYIEQLPWPAQEVAPIQKHEELMRLGERFHRLVERAENGIERSLLAAGLNPPLANWFEAYCRYRPNDLPEAYVEIEKVLHVAVNHLLSDSGTPRPTLRLAAKYDLIAAEGNGRAVIVDWKTAKRRTDPGTLRRRVQTWLYPYVLVEASERLAWGPLQPEQVEMRYWFTAAPGQPITFRYDRAQHQQNGDKVRRLLDQILSSADEADFPLIVDNENNRKRYCNYCVYRSRCNRGQRAGSLDQLDDHEEFFAVDLATALEFKLSDVGELAF
jgi:hypothetical protein